jgi:hypothetical protein
MPLRTRRHFARPLGRTLWFFGLNADELNGLERLRWGRRNGVRFGSLLFDGSPQKSYCFLKRWRFRLDGHLDATGDEASLSWTSSVGIAGHKCESLSNVTNGINPC